VKISAVTILLLSAAAISTVGLGQTSPTPADHPELLVQTGSSMYTGLGPVALSPDGHWYATQEVDGFQIWSIDLKAQVGHIARPGLGALFAIAADSKTILSVGNQSYIAPSIVNQNYVASSFTTPIGLINAHTGKEERHITIPDLVSSLAANPVEMVAAALEGSNNKVEVRSLDDGKLLFSDTAAPKAPSTWGIVMSRVFFSPDGALVFLSNPERLVAWDWHTQKRVLDFDAVAMYSQSLDRQIPVNYSDGKTVSTAREEHRNLLTSVNISRDGRQLMACSKDELTLFDYSSATKTFTKHPPVLGEAARSFASCGLFPGGRYYTTTVSTTNGTDEQTTLYDVFSHEGTTIEAWVDSVLPIPHQNMSVVRVVSQPPLLVGEDGSIANQPLGVPQPALMPVFSADGRKLWWGEAKGHPLLWDLGSGEAIRQSSLNVKGLRAASSGGRFLAYDDPATPAFADMIEVADPSTGKVLGHFDSYSEYLTFEPSLDGSGSLIAFISPDGKLLVDRIADGSNVFTLILEPDQLKNLHATLNIAGSQLSVALPSGVTVYALPSGKKLAAFAYDSQYSVQIYPQFSPNGAWLGISRFDEPLRLISTTDWKTERRFSPIIGSQIAFSPDSKRVAYAAGVSGLPEANHPGDDFSSGALVVDDIASGKHIHTTSGLFTTTAFSSDGRLLLAQASGGAQLLDATTGKLLATLYVFDASSFYDWLVVTPDGLFDGSPGAWARVSWRMSTDSFEVAPVELFFREFYHPALLADLMAGKPLVAPADLGALDRRQPGVNLRGDGNVDNVDTKQVKVHLTVAESRAPATGRHGGSGAQDLRLFRNGTLVKIWRGPLMLDANGEVSLDVDVPIVAGTNRFTAYAFNAANIKSNDAALVVTGAESLNRKGVAYVIAIGINKYAGDGPGQRMNLNFAEADAEDFTSRFAASQGALGTFDRINAVSLTSADATRDNILDALQVLAGKPKNMLTASQQALFAPLNAVLPEDGVFLFYAGHGAASAGHFYLLPHDYDPLLAPSDAAARAISEMDLSIALENISPSRAFLVIDACQSGKALDSSGAVGPMNSTGLAQLAYEKGLFILAASQGFESALEAPQLAGGHGYLTYALIEDGLKNNQAAENGIVELRPWFEYASRRVPDLQTALLTRANTGGRGFTIEDEVKDPSLSSVRIRQHPRVFYRREPEITPFVIEKEAGR